MTSAMTSRQRVLAALAHQEPDRVPIDLGGTLASGINYRAYEELLSYLGLHEKWTWDAERSQTAQVSEQVRRRLQLDVVGVRSPSHAPLRRWREGDLECWEDNWGVTWACPPGGHYYTAKWPFAGDPSIADLNAFPWPDPTDPIWTEGVVEAVEAARAQGDYAVCLILPVGMVHQSQFMRGYEAWLTDTLLNRPFLEALMDRILEIQLEVFRRVVSLVADRVDIVAFGDDVAFQGGPMLSPRLYDALIAPRHRRVFDALHAATRAAVYYHTCGSVVSMIPQLIDMGVDILNPVQVSAAGMDTAQLKRQYGRQLCFWGAIDTHHVLPFGTPDEVRNEVRRRIDDLAAGGGYVLAAVHNVQHGVPPANIVAMFDEALRYGRRS